MEPYSYDEILTRYIGTFGLYHIGMVFLVSLDCITYAFYTMMPVFIANTPPHVCEHLPGNCSLEDVMSWETCSETNGCGRCLVPDLNFTHLTNCSFAPSFLPTGDANYQRCESWTYEETFYSDTAVKEWNLVCDRNSEASSISGSYMLGRFVACLLFGSLSDIFGRRKVMLCSTVLTFACALIGAFVTNFHAFLFLRFMLAVADMIRSSNGFVMGVEFFHISKRVFFTGTWALVWVAGNVLLIVVAYLIRDWRHLQIASTMPEILFFFLYFCFLPESPRWLLLRKRHREARAVIERMAKINKRKLPEGWDVKIDEEQVKKVSFTEVLKAPRLLVMTLLLAYLFFTGSFVYYGLALSISELAGNAYLNFFLYSLVEALGYLFVAVAYNRFARLLPFGICFIGAGIALFLTVFIPEDRAWITVMFAILGKFFTTIAFIIVWLVTVEIFPTSARGVGLGVCNSAARLAAVLSSYVYLLAHFHAAIPVVLFTIMALVAGSLVFVLPETRGHSLPQTVNEGETFVKENMCKYSCSRRKPMEESTIHVES